MATTNPFEITAPDPTKSMATNAATAASSPTPATASDVKGIALEGLGTQLQVYIAGEKTDTKSCNLIGLLNRVNFDDGTAKQRFQQPSFNPPVVLKQRPSNNIFSVRMVNTISGSASAGMGGTYILILHFSKKTNFMFPSGI